MAVVVCDLDSLAEATNSAVITYSANLSHTSVAVIELDYLPGFDVVSEGAAESLVSLNGGTTTLSVGEAASQVFLSRILVFDISSQGEASSEVNRFDTVDLVSTGSATQQFAYNLVYDYDPPIQPFVTGDRVRDTIVVSSEVYTSTAYSYDVTSTGGAVSITQLGFDEIVSSEGQTVSAVSAKNIATSDLLTTGVGESALQGTNVVIRDLLTQVLATDSTNNSATVTVDIESADTIAEALAPFDRMSVNDADAGIAYVLGSVKNALSVYQNYGLRESCMLGGKYFGLSTEGLNILDQDRDEGNQEIASKIRTGVFDFFTPQRKRIQDFFLLGHMGNSQVDVRSAINTTYTYPVINKTEVGSSQVSRAILGKGASSVYWEFTFRNLDGSDFKIRGIQILTKNSDRKI